MFMKKLLIVLILLALPVSASALEYKVLAVVNGHAISTVQVRDRVNLIISSAGLHDTPEIRSNTTKEVVEILINEAVQEQEAKEKNIALTDDEMKAVMADLERKNGLKPGGMKGFVVSKGQSYEAVIEQIRASLTWQKFLARIIRPQIQITDKDIKDAAAKPVSNPEDTITKVDLSEIVVPIEFGKEQESKDLAETIVRTARSGAKSFGDLAEKYSVGKTAKDHKGELGWIPEKGVVEPLASMIKSTKEGSVSDAVKINSMYIILKVNKRQTIDTQAAMKPRSPEERALVTKVEAEAKKYIKGLRDKAYVERKYNPDQLMSFVWGDSKPAEAKPAAATKPFGPTKKTAAKKATTKKSPAETTVTVTEPAEPVKDEPAKDGATDATSTEPSATSVTEPVAAAPGEGEPTKDAPAK